MEIDIKYNVGQEVFYIREDDSKLERAIHKCECGIEHIHLVKHYSVFKSTIVNIMASCNETEFGKNVILNKPFRIEYQLKDGWYVKDNHIFLTREKADKHIDNPNRRVL